MYCNKCGNQINSNQKFCNKCGNQIKFESNKVDLETEDIELPLNQKSEYKGLMVLRILSGIFSLLSIVSMLFGLGDSRLIGLGILSLTISTVIFIICLCLEKSVFSKNSDALTTSKANDVSKNVSEFVNEPIDGVEQKPKKSAVNIIMNIFWAIFGGLIYSLVWLLVGVFYCITIIGIPVGMQCFKFAKLTLAPFGKEIVYGGNTGKFIVNIIWIIFTGFWSAVAYAVTGLGFCITLIGIPLGLQYFKLAKLMFMPFGATIIDKE